MKANTKYVEAIDIVSLMVHQGSLIITFRLCDSEEETFLNLEINANTFLMSFDGNYIKYIKDEYIKFLNDKIICKE